VTPAGPGADPGAEGHPIIDGHPVIDGHNDLPIAMRELVGYDLDVYDLGVRQSRTRTDLVRLAQGGVRGQFWSVYVPAAWAGEQAVTATLEQIDFVHRMVARYPDRLAMAVSAEQVRSAWATGRIASLMGAEGGHSIACSLGVLRSLFALGVRYMTLTHNDNVPWADSATDVRAAGGLTDFGRDVVAEMNRLGMLVDLSHTSVETMDDALDASRAPVIFSHSSARAICDHVRNVPDEQLRRLSGNGGVCMVTFVPQFVSQACRQWDAQVLADVAAAGDNPRDWSTHMAAVARRAQGDPPPVATVAQVADHVEHVRAVAGIEHVGLGGDFDGCDPMPVGLEDVAAYPALVTELVTRGWSEPELDALTHGNILRVLADGADVARDTMV
jgi:membrane dipeptidase